LSDERAADFCRQFSTSKRLRRASSAREHGMTLRYTQPGKPNQNAYIERFNRTYREEVLDRHLFASLEDVREATWQFLIDYNEHRPHDALDEMTPIEYRNHHAGISTFEVSA
jgi:putative transposase